MNAPPYTGYDPREPATDPAWHLRPEDEAALAEALALSDAAVPTDLRLDSGQTIALPSLYLSTLRVHADSGVPRLRYEAAQRARKLLAALSQQPA